MHTPLRNDGLQPHLNNAVGAAGLSLHSWWCVMSAELVALRLQVAINDQIAVIRMQDFRGVEPTPFINGNMCLLSVDWGVVWLNRSSPPATPLVRPICLAAPALACKAAPKPPDRCTWVAGWVWTHLEPHCLGVWLCVPSDAPINKRLRFTVVFATPYIALLHVDIGDPYAHILRYLGLNVWPSESQEGVGHHHSTPSVSPTPPQDPVVGMVPTHPAPASDSKVRCTSCASHPSRDLGVWVGVDRPSVGGCTMRPLAISQDSTRVARLRQHLHVDLASSYPRKVL